MLSRFIVAAVCVPVSPSFSVPSGIPLCGSATLCVCIHQLVDLGYPHFVAVLCDADINSHSFLCAHVSSSFEHALRSDFIMWLLWISHFEELLSKAATPFYIPTGNEWAAAGN